MVEPWGHHVDSMQQPNSDKLQAVEVTNVGQFMSNVCEMGKFIGPIQAQLFNFAEIFSPFQNKKSLAAENPLVSLKVAKRLVSYYDDTGEIEHFRHSVCTMFL